MLKTSAWFVLFDFDIDNLTQFTYSKLYYSWKYVSTVHMRRKEIESGRTNQQKSFYAPIFDA